MCAGTTGRISGRAMASAITSVSGVVDDVTMHRESDVPEHRLSVDGHVAVQREHGG